MKKNVFKLGLVALMVAGLTSCKDEKKEMADNRIAELEKYVDSLKSVSVENMESNWSQISADYDAKTMEINNSISELKEENKEATQEKATAVMAEYDALKMQVETKIEATKMSANPNQTLRDQLFGAGKIGEDMNFAWVNKDNILATYQNFFDAYKANKGNFSREDYDEVKLMYEALDSRKNTVEKEGLTSEDNGEIAAIKFKFAPMFKVNRIGAKSREMEAAKAE
jgi:hypothetical protein